MVRVKLVSQPGIGQIAVGVAKARADEIHIAGHSGGTGASPATSIKGAGNPVELGVAEVHQALKANGLRPDIRLVADGNVVDGDDMLKLMMLGADEVGIGTAGLVAMGCLMTRKCHLNTCPAGVATQDERLEAFYGGKPEFLENYYTFMAKDVRQKLTTLGVKNIGDVVGRTDLLEQISSFVGEDLSRMLALAPQERGQSSGARVPDGKRNELPIMLDQKLSAQEIVGRIKRGEKVVLESAIDATNLSVGAGFAGEIVSQIILNAIDQVKLDRDESGKIDQGKFEATVAKLKRDIWPADNALTIRFTGNAGQSFGVWLVPGMRWELEGAANDYVGKGMSGGTLVLRPSAQSAMTEASNEIAGNTLFYGATGGEAFIRGRVNERFMVRGSGARVVVEGCGDFGCEYMSGGVAVILGKIGQSFAAGMKGGLAFIYDEDGTAENRVDKSGVRVLPFGNAEFEKIRLNRDVMDSALKSMIEKQRQETGSPKAAEILADWDRKKHHFRVVASKELFALALGAEYRVNAMKFFYGLPAAKRLRAPLMAA